ncbi:ABC transporter ATP-binding protein [Frankia sp. Cr2]|uniref:ABC transporter ATP-binding protein n=1 Tax=Frankia sp. Cr2 TaxID=3073932 RepID=UPI002AD59CFC|nr:ABC transporter ATP-binding protein [Frankia sp. Cr2]
MASVVFDHATHSYAGAGAAPAVDRLDLRIDDGEFMVLVGPSGSGKSTALRMLAGLESVDAGAIRIGSDDVTALPPARRDIAMVFQNYALYPHMDVAANMGFALKIAGMAKPERDRRVREAARLLDLEPYLARKPRNLSGGQRQRVAMGRAIVREPRVFLMDEPLSNLDAKLRVQTRSQIAELTARLGVTTVYVTHDQVEAMTMGDRVAVLRDGVLQQVATPRQLYNSPANVFVAGFIGSPAMNLHTVPLVGRCAVLGGLQVELPAAALAAAAAEQLTHVRVGIRPESFAPVEQVAGGTVTGRVELVEDLGSDTYIHVAVDLPDGPAGFVVRADGRIQIHRNESLRLSVDPAEVHFFDPTTGSRLG